MHPSDDAPHAVTIVWWPWMVLAAGPLVAAGIASTDDGSEATVPTLFIVALLALLFLAVIFAPALVIISQQRAAPADARRRAAIVFTVCVAGAHVLGQLIDRSVGSGEATALSGLAFIGVYVASSALATVGVRRELLR